MKKILDNKKQYKYIISKVAMESHLTESKVVNHCLDVYAVDETQLGFNAEVATGVKMLSNV